MDPYLCCLLGICCPPNSVEQHDKLMAIVMERGWCKNKEEAERRVKVDLELVQKFRNGVNQMLDR